MKWMYYTKDIGKQVNTTLVAVVLFLLFYVMFDYFESLSWILRFFKILCAVFAAYLFVFSLLLIKKWIDKMYK